MCFGADGVDGAVEMIKKAKKYDPKGRYHDNFLSSWKPFKPVELVTAMEVLYYLEDIPTFLKNVHEDWLVPGGVIVIGIDYYKENEASHDMPDKYRTKMTLHSTDEWITFFQEAGFEVQKVW